MKYPRFLSLLIISASLVLSACGGPAPAAQTGMTQMENQPAVEEPKVIGTLEEVTTLDSLFSESGTVQSEHIRMRVSSKTLAGLGIPGGFKVDTAKLEDTYKTILSRWAWATAKNSDDSRLTVFRNSEDIDQRDVQKMLADYDSNTALGNQGFDYNFTFGTIHGSQSKLSGIVKKIDISVTNDPKEWLEIVDFLTRNKTPYTIDQAMGGPGMAIFYLDDGGKLTIITNGYGEDDRTYTEKFISQYLALTFAIPLCEGEWMIRMANGTQTASLSDPQPLAYLFDCSVKFCADPGATSDFKY